MTTLHLARLGPAYVGIAYDIALLYSNGWLSSFSNSPDGRYDYHAFYSWFLLANDDSFSILIKMWYIDIEEAIYCLSDGLVVRICIFLSRGRYLIVVPRCEKTTTFFLHMQKQRSSLHVLA